MWSHIVPREKKCHSHNDAYVKSYEPKFPYQGLLRLAREIIKLEVDDIKSLTIAKEFTDLLQSERVVKYKDPRVPLITCKFEVVCL